VWHKHNEQISEFVFDMEYQSKTNAEYCTRLITSNYIKPEDKNTNKDK